MTPYPDHVHGWRGSPRIARMRVPLQIGRLAGVCIGAALVTVGVLALAGTGIDLDDVTRPRREILGLEHNPLLASLAVLFGVLVIRAQSAGFSGWRMARQGWLAVAAGVVVLFTHRDLHATLATGAEHGVVMIAIGAALILLARLAAASMRAMSGYRPRRDRPGPSPPDSR